MDLDSCGVKSKAAAPLHTPGEALAAGKKRKAS